MSQGSSDSTSATAPSANGKPKGGRPRALDEAKRREVCALVSAGGSIEWAAMYVGCSPSTIRRQARRDPAFYSQLRQAALAAQLHPLNALRQASTTHWRAAAWMLERIQPSRFIPRRSEAVRKTDLEAFYKLMCNLMLEEGADPKMIDRIYRRMSRDAKQFLGHL
jgi:hypothetical protein